MEKYKIINLGRGKWCGEIKAQTDHPEHVEAALMRIARKHLLSDGIDFDGDVDSGFFIVGGFRKVGKYKRIEEVKHETGTQ